MTPHHSARRTSVKSEKSVIRDSPSLPFELAYRACLRREADADLVELALVCCVWQGIALVVYLLEGGRGCAVQLELEDVDVGGTFEHTVYASLARLLLHVGVVLA